MYDRLCENGQYTIIAMLSKFNHILIVCLQQVINYSWNLILKLSVGNAQMHKNTWEPCCPKTHLCFYILFTMIIGDHVGIQAHTYFLHLHQTYFTCEKIKKNRPKTKYIVIVYIIANYNLLIPSSFYKLTMIRLFLMHLFRNKSKHESYPRSKFHNISLIHNISKIS